MTPSASMATMPTILCMRACLPCPAPNTIASPCIACAGNEGSLDLYINNTGLMWENAESFGALVVFAEHRYYGQSEPFGKDSWKVCR